jgi:hypothetical protein
MVFPFGGFQKLTNWARVSDRSGQLAFYVVVDSNRRSEAKDLRDVRYPGSDHYSVFAGEKGAESRQTLHPVARGERFLAARIAVVIIT